MAEDRRGPHRPRPGDRPAFAGSRSFRPPAPRPDFAQLSHTLRLRDGDREVEVSGSAPFVRQALDDLPVLLARLRGEAARPASIRIPPPQAAVDPVAAPPVTAAGDGTIEERVIDILREARRPLAVAAIRKQLGSGVTPQQVRRAIERAADRITATGERPARYRLSRP